jgi:pimeloyl-ACP methyl ester carboxylesterase
MPVMDAVGVERAALLGWGTGGPPLAVFFAATHPERTIAMCIDPLVYERWSSVVGQEEEEFERDLAQMTATWGEEDSGASGYDDAPNDPEFLRWSAKSGRFSATPGSMAALTRMWFSDNRRPQQACTIRGGGGPVLPGRCPGGPRCPSCP